RAFLPAPSVGEGEPFVELQAVELDASANRLLLMNRAGLDDVDVVSIDLGNGTRSKLHDLDSGAGNPITTVVDTVLDSAAGVLWVLSGSDALFSVDTSTGEKRRVSGDGTGDGPDFGTGVNGL